ncbi:Uu.00g031870.m01.CDS01 [Anthostomella pinea]|uniref:Uu.00g031870.m01.CDS01 n=1 Tax=Anthostomella pinea TaxID=933095 RepID=A0AAI8V8F3_9PEZI|nr:Uu.00g031870.m01.CDS01 [Anthostomella pinea]
MTSTHNAVTIKMNAAHGPSDWLNLVVMGGRQRGEVVIQRLFVTRVELQQPREEEICHRDQPALML